MDRAVAAYIGYVCIWGWECVSCIYSADCMQSDDSIHLLQTLSVHVPCLLYIYSISSKLLIMNFVMHSYISP